MWISRLVIALILSLTNANLVRENVVFEKINEIATTRSKWLVAIQLDFDPYKELIQRVDESLASAKTQLSRIKTKTGKISIGPLKQNTLDMINLLAVEFKNFELSRDYLWQEFSEIRGIHRPKRSLLPVIGKTLSILFGTLTEADIESLRINIRRIAHDQVNLRHVFNESLSIMRTIQGQVKENRDTINQVLVNLKELADRIANNQANLERITEYVSAYTTLDRASAEINELLNIAREHLQILRSQLNMLSLGHLSPTVISPRELRRILVDIRKELSPHFKLPAEPEQDMWDLYKTIPCTTLIDSEHIIVVIAIPLLDNSGMYDMFRIHNLPIPYHKTREINMRAHYQLEAPYLAVNKEITQFTILTKQEADICANPMRPYCTFRNPAYNIRASKMCVIQIYINKKDKIRKYCREIITQDPLPQAQYLTDGHWLVTSERPLTFSVLCDKARHSVINTSPIDIVSLQPTCAAHNSHFSLLPYYTRETKFHIDSSFRKVLKQYQTMPIWSKLEIEIPNSTISIPPKLKDIQEFTIDKLIEELQAYHLTLEPMATSVYWGPGIALTLIILIILVICFRKQLLKLLMRFKSWYKCKKRSRKRGIRKQGVSSPSETGTEQSTTNPSTAMVRYCDDQVFFHRPDEQSQSVMDKPDMKLAVRYWKEKYGLVPNDAIIADAQPEANSGAEQIPEKFKNRVHKKILRDWATSTEVGCDVNIDADKPASSSAGAMSSSVYPSLQAEIARYGEMPAMDAGKV